MTAKEMFSELGFDEASYIENRDYISRENQERITLVDCNIGHEMFCMEVYDNVGEIRCIAISAKEVRAMAKLLDEAEVE